MSTATLTRPKAPKVPTDIVTALLAQGGGYVIQDAAGAVYAVPLLTPEQGEDPEVLVLAEFFDAARAQAHGASCAAIARDLTATLVNQHARGLL